MEYQDGAEPIDQIKCRILEIVRARGSEDAIIPCLHHPMSSALGETKV